MPSTSGGLDIVCPPNISPRVLSAEIVKLEPAIAVGIITDAKPDIPTQPSTMSADYEHIVDSPRERGC